MQIHQPKQLADREHYHLEVLDVRSDNVPQRCQRPQLRTVVQIKRCTDSIRLCILHCTVPAHARRRRDERRDAGHLQPAWLDALVFAHQRSPVKLVGEMLRKCGVATLVMDGLLLGQHRVHAEISILDQGATKVHAVGLARLEHDSAERACR
eukprot:6172848-Pleurochrysis_carterae.AAC.1